MKHLLVCCDGTWNTPDQRESGVSAPTNVAKLAQAFAPVAQDGRPQIVYYLAGVGASAGYDLSHWVGGAFGVGLSQLICDMYRFLVLNYTDGDTLGFFGFSRGAYAVRSLAGLIRNCGVLHPRHAAQLPTAYGLYRRGDALAAPEGLEACAFRAAYAREVTIHCLGVWDTVGALGIPDHVLRLLTEGWWQFHDVTLSRHVAHAYQALAIDEHRADFPPTLWAQQPDAGGQVLAQVWFPGSHGNVGGGYDDSGLSDLALDWMLENVTTCGYAVDRTRLSGFAPNPLAPLRDSMTGLFHLRRAVVRPIGQGGLTGETVHPSAYLRQEATLQPRYRPRNVPRSAVPPGEPTEELVPAVPPAAPGAGGEERP